MSHVWLLILVSGIALAFAVILGGLEERIVAAAQAVSVVADDLVGAAFTGKNAGAEMSIDLILLAVILPIAFRTSKIWPLVVASLCVVALETEAAQMLASVSARTYVVTQGLWEVLTCAVVSLGAWKAWRARRANNIGLASPGPVSQPA